MPLHANIYFLSHLKLLANVVHWEAGKQRKWENIFLLLFLSLNLIILMAVRRTRNFSHLSPSITLSVQPKLNIYHLWTLYPKTGTKDPKASHVNVYIYLLRTDSCRGFLLPAGRVTHARHRPLRAPHLLMPHRSGAAPSTALRDLLIHWCLCFHFTNK